MASSLREGHRCVCVMDCVTLSSVSDSSCACGTAGTQTFASNQHTNTPGILVTWFDSCYVPCCLHFPCCGVPCWQRGRHMGTSAGWWNTGTVMAGTVRCHMLPRGVMEVGFCSWLRHQLSTWEVCIHLLHALSLCDVPSAVKWGSQLSGAVLRLSPVLGADSEGSRVWTAPSEPF